MNSAASQSQDSESGDLAELMATLWAGRLWIVAGAALLALLAAAAAFVMTPVYRSTAVLIATDTGRNSLSSSLGSSLGSLGGLAALANINLGSSGAATEEALAVLTSRQFTDAFISDTNLLPILFSKKWDSASNRWKGPPDKQPTASAGFRYFDRSVRSVTQDKKTGLISLQIDWKDPNLAALWANELVNRLNAEMQRRAISQADASLGFLNKELARTSVTETRSAINRLIEAQINGRMMASVTEQYAFRVVDPAVPPDRSDMVKPRRLVMIAVGGLLGLLVSCVLVALGGRRVVVPRQR
jgi:uncharacterized protein involved in exopolysaccharide biosynthesis